MRWFWIDRFVEFESGVRARAIKNISLAEDHLHDHFPAYPVMPGTLMIEGMAQTSGILLGGLSGFDALIILAKVPKVIFHSLACPGDTLVYDAKILDSNEQGGMVECTARVGERLVAEIEIVFARIPQSSYPTLSQESLVTTLRSSGLGASEGRPGD
jgi:3-hydroxyacyl-[acyl-carrier-protein] dehydratase